MSNLFKYIDIHRYIIFYLSVGHAPDFIKKLHNAKGAIGGEAVFTVQTDGKPVPEIIW